jgi:hypothetical protein
MHNNTDPDENNNPNSTATLAEPAILSTVSQHFQEEDNEFNATVQQNQTNKRIQRKNKQKKTLEPNAVGVITEFYPAILSSINQSVQLQYRQLEIAEESIVIQREILNVKRQKLELEKDKFQLWKEQSMSSNYEHTEYLVQP